MTGASETGSTGVSTAGSITFSTGVSAGASTFLAFLTDFFITIPNSSLIHSQILKKTRM